MYAYPLEELTWAITRERAEEARQTRPHTEERPRLVEPLRSWLARWLVGVGDRPDHVAGRSSPRAVGNDCC